MAPAEFLELIQRNAANRRILERLPGLDLPDALLVSGCLVQTVWNCLAGKPLESDIADYDLFYHDAGDLSWEAEDAAIRRCRDAFADLGVDVQVRNQARVHLWYEKHFGLACAPLLSSRDGVDHFLNRSSCFGVGWREGALDVYAPFGFADLFSMIVRPNTRRALPHVYYEKARRWLGAWPNLAVMPWPGVPEAIHD